MNIENLTEEEIRQREAMLNDMYNEIKPMEQHYGSVENLSDEDTKQRENMIKSTYSEVKPMEQHYGSVENLDDNATRQQEAMIKGIYSEVKPIEQHYGPIEDADPSTLRMYEEQVREQRQADKPHKDYLNSLIENPNLYNDQQFEDAVIRSMQSNRIISNFTQNIVEKISEKAYTFKNIDPTDQASINNQKQQLEKLVFIYEKYLYTLKSNQWEFNGPAYDSVTRIDEDTINKISQVQKNYDITFEMPIPRDLESDYGKAFERNARMIPGITYMYDDLQNKPMNWHQVMIYRENELTPKQRYEQNRQESLKEFEQARQEEMKNNLDYVRSQRNEKDAMFEELENQEQIVESTSYRR